MFSQIATMKTERDLLNFLLVAHQPGPVSMGAGPPFPLGPGRRHGEFLRLQKLIAVAPGCVGVITRVIPQNAAFPCSSHPTTAPLQTG